MKGHKGFTKGHKDFRTPEGIKSGALKNALIERDAEWRRKIGDSNRRAFADGRKSVSGSKNPAWKGGVTSESQRARHSLEYAVWRDEVYRKDNWSCRICKQKCRKGQIVAHHIKLFSEFPELRYSVDNGVTLCRACHAALHKGTKQI